MLHNIFLSLMILIFSQNIFAQKMGLALGTSQVNVDAEAGIEAQSQGGLLGGALFYSKPNGAFMPRVGVLYSQKNFTLTTSGVKTNVNLSYLQVPLTMGFVVNPNFAFFGGLDLNLNVSKSCSYEGLSGTSCTPKGVSSADMGLNLGINLTFMDEFGVEVFYDKSFSKIIDGTSGAATFGISLLYLIE